MNMPSRSMTRAALSLLALLAASPACTSSPLDFEADAGTIMGVPDRPPANAFDATAAPDAATPPPQADAASPNAAPPEPDPPPPPDEPVSADVVAGDWRPPAFCHDLAPAAGTLQTTFFPDVCPSGRALHGGRILDGIYRVVRSEICRSTPGTLQTRPVRIRISGDGTRLDWSSDVPVFSAHIATEGTALQVTETCRWAPGDSPQPPYTEQFSVSGDQLTIYTVLGSMVFRREP
jgi:hypothetical protein